MWCGNQEHVGGLDDVVEAVECARQQHAEALVEIADLLIELVAVRSVTDNPQASLGPPGSDDSPSSDEITEAMSGVKSADGERDGSIGRDNQVSIDRGQSGTGGVAHCRMARRRRNRGARNDLHAMTGEAASKERVGQLLTRRNGNECFAAAGSDAWAERGGGLPSQVVVAGD